MYWTTTLNHNNATYALPFAMIMYQGLKSNKNQHPLQRSEAN